MTREQVKHVVAENGGRKENILAMLLDCQYASEQNFVDRETAGHIAQELELSETRVFELLSYYAMLNTTPKAKHILQVCHSSPCHFSGENWVLETLQKKLGVKVGEATADGLFLIEHTPCVGACDIGPVIKVRDRVFGSLDETAIDALLDGLRAGSLEQ